MCNENYWVCVLTFCLFFTSTVKLDFSTRHYPDAVDRAGAEQKELSLALNPKKEASDIHSLKLADCLNEQQKHNSEILT